MISKRYLRVGTSIPAMSTRLHNGKVLVRFDWNFGFAAAKLGSSSQITKNIAGMTTLKIYQQPLHPKPFQSKGKSLVNWALWCPLRKSRTQRIPSGETSSSSSSPAVSCTFWMNLGRHCAAYCPNSLSDWRCCRSNFLTVAVRDQHLMQIDSLLSLNIHLHITIQFCNSAHLRRSSTDLAPSPDSVEQARIFSTEKKQINNMLLYIP